MLKNLLAFICLTLSIGANAVIVSLDSEFGPDTITRDTSTGLDWLDVTETRGLSYNYVKANMGDGSAYEGYRYATLAELDQLIINFGYVAINTNCLNGALHCDEGLTSESELIETIIDTLGDTFDAHSDAGLSSVDVAEGGAGEVRGMLGSRSDGTGWLDEALIQDRELVNRNDGSPLLNYRDALQTQRTNAYDYGQNLQAGSFLVAPSTVPIPAAAYLFGSALLGLVAASRRK
jgi:hypothetical protein